jgi:hypothetical protein
VAVVLVAGTQVTFAETAPKEVALAMPAKTPTGAGLLCTVPFTVTDSKQPVTIKMLTERIADVPILQVQNRLAKIPLTIFENVKNVPLFILF